MSKEKQLFDEICKPADIKINGDRSWDIKVNNPQLYKRVLAQGIIGLGEAYMDGWWDCDQIDELVFRALQAKLTKDFSYFGTLLSSAVKAKVQHLATKIVNQQRKSKAAHVAEHHYDIGNNLYEKMLDKRMLYTCAYWKDAKNLDQAQENKLRLICEKLELKPGMKLLDLGCGWAGLSKYAAENYGVEAVAYNVSKEQVKWARESCKGLPVEIRLQDYREAEGSYDRIASIGMCEHVGPKNYRNFMKLAAGCLKDDGLFLLHTIGKNNQREPSNPWTLKYIFPRGSLPASTQLTSAMEGIFKLEDWHSFGADYDHTLMAWYENFSRNWDEIKKDPKYDERFRRMWTLYLLGAAGSFRARSAQVWQIVLSKDGIVGGYNGLR